MRRLFSLVMLMCLGISQKLPAQDSFHLLDKALSFPNRFFNRVQRNYSNVDGQLTRQTEKYLQRLEKQENKLKRNLSKIDPSKAQQLFSNVEYKTLAKKITQKLPLSKNELSGEYEAYVDSIGTSLSFLAKNKIGIKEYTDKAENSLNQFNQLQSKLKYSEQIKNYIQRRKVELKEALTGYTTLPKSLTRNLENYQKEAFYFSQQVKEYKDALNDPDKLVKKGLAILNKVPAYQDFMKQHGELAGLFNIPTSYGNAGNVAGLQTKSQVLETIQSQLSCPGQNGIQVLQQNMQAGMKNLNEQIDQKLKKLAPGNNDIDMPNFKPNNQRTKTFWNRLEYGTNFQTVKTNFFPTTSDFGLSIGYKLNDKSTVGVGASYKMGWGQDFKHITITHQGMGIRTFLDIKLKGSFYASGGFEYNYQPLKTDTATSNLAHWVEISSWQKSGLVGISKIISIKSKFFKKTKLQFLWDFLSYQQVPRAQPLKFRVGYTF